MMAEDVTYRKKKVKVKSTLEQAMKAQEGARWGWVVNATPRSLCPQERDPVPIVQEAGWAPRPRLRMSGGVPLLPLYAFMAWTGTTLL
jgi:hypothetical protein